MKIITIAAVAALSFVSAHADVQVNREGGALIIRDDNPGTKYTMPIVNPFESRYATCGQAGIRHAGHQVMVDTCRIWEFKPSKAQMAAFNRGEQK